MSKRSVISRVCLASEVARVFMEAEVSLRDNPKILLVQSHIESGNVSAGLSLLETCREEYIDSPSHFRIYSQYRALLKKVPFQLTNCDRDAVAASSLFRTERKCGRINRKLAYYSGRPERMPESVRACVTRSRVLIRKYLGAFTAPVYLKILNLSRPGPGISIGTWNKMRTSFTYKYVATTPHFTPAMSPVAMDWIRLNQRVIATHAVWGSGLSIKFPYRDWYVSGNRVTFVPKDGRTSRSIAVEPAMNMQLQLGVHEYLLKRLRIYADTDLTSQETNQKLAYLGSRYTGPNGLVTLDLSSASDSISIELVKLLLPPDWYSFLDLLRSPTFSFKGQTYETKKFSTMGNGFTFVLETAIFKAISEAARSICGGSVTSVYGDDIITDQRTALLLTEVLKFLGFSINTEKSFYFGGFRESCGADWHSGLYTSPVYLKVDTLQHPDAYRVYNTIRRSRGGRAVRSFLLRKLRETPYIHYGLVNEDTTSCLFTSFDYLKGSGQLRYHADHQSWQFRCLASRPTFDTAAPVEWRLLNAIWSGKGTLSLRGGNKVVVRWKSAGRVPNGWFTPLIEDYVWQTSSDAPD